MSRKNGFFLDSINQAVNAGILNSRLSSLQITRTYNLKTYGGTCFLKQFIYYVYLNDRDKLEYIQLFNWVIWVRFQCWTIRRVILHPQRISFFSVKSTFCLMKHNKHFHKPLQNLNLRLLSENIIVMLKKDTVLISTSRKQNIDLL